MDPSLCWDGETLGGEELPCSGADLDQEPLQLPFATCPVVSLAGAKASGFQSQDGFQGSYTFQNLPS